MRAGLVGGEAILLLLLQFSRGLFLSFSFLHACLFFSRFLSVFRVLEKS